MRVGIKNSIFLHGETIRSTASGTVVFPLRNLQSFYWVLSFRYCLLYQTYIEEACTTQEPPPRPLRRVVMGLGAAAIPIFLRV